jgi:hypothetical protein
MNFYAVIGRRSAVQIRTLILDRRAQEELTETFASLSETVRQADQVNFDPSYRADGGEVITISDYQLPSTFARFRTLQRLGN